MTSEAYSPGIQTILFTVHLSNLMQLASLNFDERIPIPDRVLAINSCQVPITWPVKLKSSRFDLERSESRRPGEIPFVCSSKSRRPLIAGERPPPHWCSTRERTWLARTSAKYFRRMGLAQPRQPLASLSSISRMCPTSRSRRMAPCTRPRASTVRPGRITASR